MENNSERLLQVIQQINSEKDNRLRERVMEIVSDLIAKDFEKLVQLLYLVDVNENKLKKLLKEYPNQDAAVLITDLLIERQLEKIKTKNSFRKPGEIADDEKW